MSEDLKPLVPPLREVGISRRILTVRGHRVNIDADLAEIYGVPTKALNQAVKRNSNRFPVDFAFRLTTEEKSELVTICDRTCSIPSSRRYGSIDRIFRREQYTFSREKAAGRSK